MALPSLLKKSRKSTSEVSGTTPVVEARPGAKNRPTPKRAEKSVVVTGAYMKTGGGSKKENAKADRERRRAEMDATRAAMKGTGDIRKLPARDARPEATFARDFVDNRRNLTTIILLVYIVFALNIVLGGVTVLVTLALTLFLVSVVDMVVLGISVTRAMKKEFPDSRERIRVYSIQRAVLPRRFRSPRPGVGVPSRGWRGR